MSSLEPIAYHWKLSWTWEYVRDGDFAIVIAEQFQRPRQKMIAER